MNLAQLSASGGFLRLKRGPGPCWNLSELNVRAPTSQLIAVCLRLAGAKGRTIDKFFCWGGELLVQVKSPSAASKPCSNSAPFSSAVLSPTSARADIGLCRHAHNRLETVVEKDSRNASI